MSPNGSLLEANAMSLKRKFTIQVAIAALGLLSLAGMWVKSERSCLLSERIQKTKTLVELPYSIIQRQHQLEVSGQISREQAQKDALDQIRCLRYEENNYFWITDLHPTMVMHPMKPELNGQDLSAYKDPDGILMFVAMVNAVKARGGGFVYYRWPRPGKSDPVKKLSYVKQFEPWGWIIGTGIYIDDVDAAWRSNGTIAAGLGLSCLLILLIVSTKISRSIFARLSEMVERIRDIAEGEGDLTKRLEVNTDDEVSHLGRWFNTFMDRLHDILSQVASNTHSLASAGVEIADSSRQQAEGAERQKDQANQVATAMQEMSSTVQQVSENSHRAAAASQQAAELARKGGQVVDETLSRMRAIAESVGQTAKKIDELGRQSDQIGRIIGVIDDIADQTNLLALNAAIEAARAGEQGRGFAVVADEVRKLAERTSTATKEITGMIRSIQTETKSAVTAMQAGTKEVERGVELTTQAGSSLYDIIKMSEQVGDMINQIATAATEQSAATEQINRSVEEIAHISESSAAGAKQTTTTLKDLSTLAVNLRELVNQFKLGDEDRGANQASHTQAQTSLSQEIDFARVKMSHRSWRVKLRSFLDGREDLDAFQLASHRTCELGKWIYGAGMSRYGQLSEFEQLEKTHQQMHGRVKLVVEAKHAGKLDEAEAGFAHVVEAAEQVVALLDKLEAKFARPPARAAGAGR
jgi:methyl-accepting chemotaxis protein